MCVVCAPLSLLRGGMLWAFPGHSHFFYFIRVQTVKADMLFKLKHATVAFQFGFQLATEVFKENKYMYVVNERLE